MHKNRLPIIFLRVAFGSAWIALPFACAHGVDTSLDSILTDGVGTGIAGGIPTTVGTGVGATGTGGAGGGTGVTGSTTTGTNSAGSTASTSAGSGGSSGVTGSGGSGGSTTGAGGTSTVAAGGSGGATGSGGAAGTGGTGGAVGTGGNAGAGAGGGGGKAGGGGSGGAAGTGGNAGTGGSAGAGGNAGSGGSGGMTPQPTSITLPQATTPSGQQLTITTSGTTFTQRCAANEVIIGYRGTTEPAGAPTNWLRSFQAVCATLTITGTTTYTVNTPQAETLAAHGMPQSVMLTAMCGANRIVVAFVAKTGGAIDQFIFTCAPLTISGTSPNFTLGLGPETTLSVFGGPGGTTQPIVRCPAGMVAVGDEGREGAAIEAFGLLCARPTLVVQ